MPGVKFLFHLTSQLPDTARVSLAISQIIAPDWIFPAGSFSTSGPVELDKAIDFETITPIGSFSPAFLKSIASTVKRAAPRQLAGVRRALVMSISSRQGRQDIDGRQSRWRSNAAARHCLVSIWAWHVPCGLDGACLTEGRLTLFSSIGIRNGRLVFFPWPQPPHMTGHVRTPVRVHSSRNKKASS